MGLLLDKYVNFLEEVLNVYEEKNKGKGKYIGKVSFDSRVLDSQDQITYNGPPGHRARVVSHTAETKKPLPAKKEQEVPARTATFVPKQPKPEDEEIKVQQQPRKVVQEQPEPVPNRKEPSPPPRRVAETPLKPALRAESEGRKRVKINEVPEYAPAKVVSILKNDAAQSRKAASHNTIVVLIPMGIPGMGKSTLIETHLRPYFAGTSINFTTFGSDKIRKEIIDE